MRLRPLRVEKEPKLMIIPMIDIIFFLLVFFMMSMLSMVVQKSISLNLPQTATAKINMETTLPVSITEDGSIYIESQKVDKSLFRKRMEVEKARNPNLSIVLRADAQSRHEDFVYVLDQLKSVGISRVGIATETKVSDAK